MAQNYPTNNYYHYNQPTYQNYTHPTNRNNFSYTNPYNATSGMNSQHFTPTQPYYPPYSQPYNYPQPQTTYPASSNYDYTNNFTPLNAILFYDANDPYYEFTNFSPNGFNLNGKFWPTSEHYFQAQKFRNHPYLMEQVRKLSRPRDAFDFVRKPENNFFVSKNWANEKETVMSEALYAKFTSDKILRNLLLDTGERTLIEDSPVDSYWGIGRDRTGKNRLGFLLMELRTRLRAEKDNTTKKLTRSNSFSDLRSMKASLFNERKQDSLSPCRDIANILTPNTSTMGPNAIPYTNYYSYLTPPTPTPTPIITSTTPPPIITSTTPIITSTTTLNTSTPTTTTSTTHNNSYNCYLNEMVKNNADDRILFYDIQDKYFEFTLFSPHGFSIDGEYWKTGQHYFQAQKYSKHPRLMKEIQKSYSAREAFDIGRNKANQNLMGKRWDKDKIKIMKTLLQAKFKQNPSLKETLIATGNKELIYHSPDDIFWGSGKYLTGENRLGGLLMELRIDLVNEEKKYAAKPVVNSNRFDARLNYSAPASIISSTSINKISRPINSLSFSSDENENEIRKPFLRKTLSPPNDSLKLDKNKFNYTKSNNSNGLVQSTGTIYFYGSNKQHYSFTAYSPYSFKLDGKFWLTLNHYFQAQKFTRYSRIVESIINAPTPQKATEISNSNIRFQDIRKFNDIALMVMKKGLQAKFDQNSGIKKELMATGNRKLVQNSEDIWGVKGMNEMGNMLMELRAEYQRTDSQYKIPSSSTPVILPSNYYNHYIKPMSPSTFSGGISSNINPITKYPTYEKPKATPTISSRGTVASRLSQDYKFI